MTTVNLVSSMAVIAMFGVLSMCCAFWVGVAVGRRSGEKTLVSCWEEDSTSSAVGASVEFNQERSER